MEKTIQIFLIEATNNYNHQQNRANCFLHRRIAICAAKINILFCNVDFYFTAYTYFPGSFANQVHSEHHLVIFLSEGS